MIKTQTCCFTGHRNIPTEKYPEIQRALMFQVIELIHDGIRCFYAGGALGFDMMAALTVLNLKKHFPPIRFILVLPCKNQTRGWCEENKKIYNHILIEADEVIYTSEKYYSGCMHRRNRDMVELSGVCVCYMNDPESGTTYTASHARQKGLKVMNLAMN